MRLAVFLDAENFSPSLVQVAIREMDKIGTVIRRRAFGNFQLPSMSPWKTVLEGWPMTAIQVTPLAQKRNATDLSLVIDAMDLLHSGRLQGFCLVSSDSDFTRLASRIREQGVDVYGFGEQKTPASFRQACRRFIYTENLLLPENPVPEAEPGKAVRPLQPPSAAIPLLQKALAQTDNEDGWVYLGVLGHRLLSIATDFDPRTFGYRKLSDLVRKTGAFEVIQPDGGGLRVRLKHQEAKASRKKPAKQQGASSKTG